MKKNILLIVMTAIMLVGCGDIIEETKTALNEAAEQENFQSEVAEAANNEKVEAQTSENDVADAELEEDEAEAEIGNIDLNKIIGSSYKYEQYVSGENVYDHEEIHQIKLVDEKKATYSITEEYSDSKKTITEFEGTYTYSDRRIIFEYKESENAPTVYYVFKIEDNECVGVEVATCDYGSISGEYTGNIKELGKVKLNVTKDGKATLSTNKQNFVGDLVLENERWNYIGYDSKTGDIIDWYIYFSGKTFTHEGYAYTLFKSLEGNFGATGEYGYIEFQLYEDGGASKYITQDGNEVFFSGTYTVDLDTQHVTNIYLSSEKGQTFNVEIIYNADGTISYKGAIE